ncbi:sulfatase-like hydrolase/transferase [Roseobacter sp. HKCCD9010]|uniref:sulfatase family protein n=1 Tax=unclassified Roseobacter TaxID=196798 RepID=UPI001492C1C2|nr:MULTISPECIES: sulfatase-like hydrolase/transferase [unclassified Roseobacter]MBF9052380.1 sulfatase-like hydrolase/transferase [Rhodobacterales bacterium HKCCD4356]NNV13709.1 sulfatase-like hydrolase/transferase [Roseobacter sp. HKCCD7357]NNV18547.1 sulfatase-like hydrolase/transferase [Roseobacter sp. HKCCD8768]NNV27998.1 sulfatase-like hydrolase/transferase [Roseobacter sp. HKCCD8192]NNV32298.1 sulfatase-like hydrolase/transferase [Roseobacter sp. HKCCD9061]
MTKQPNIILFMTDQHRADHLGCYGNSVVKTPNIDRIAAKGVCFDRSYVANPICMPNRASILTGRMPSAHGLRSNGVSLSVHARTFVEELAEAGYDTALMGKLHVQNMTGMEREFTPPGAENLIEPDGSIREAVRRGPNGEEYQSENSIRWREHADHHVKLPYYGFQHVDLTTFHGDNVQAEYLRWLGERCDDPDSLRGPKNALPDDRITLPQAWRTAIPEELYPSSFVAEKTIDYLKKCGASDSESPFFIQCSFPDPHHPFTPPGKYWDMYDPDDMELPEAFGKGDTPTLRHLRMEQENGTAKRLGQIPFAITEREAREAIALTYGMITMVDDCIGRVLDCLEDQGLAEDTILIFMSDHGDLMGDYGVLLKGPIHNQGTVRIPFIWADPQAPSGTRSAALMSSIDVSSTILDRLGLPQYYGAQGQSMLPALHGEAPERDAILIEDDRERIYLNYDRPQRLRTMVTDTHRMTLCRPCDYHELYDLTDDPCEAQNLWDDAEPSPLMHDMQRRMMELLVDYDDWTPALNSRA